MIKAVGYVRGSTVEQEETLKAQREKIETYCALRGIELVGVYVDTGISGTVPLESRENAAVMLQALKSRSKDKPTAVIAVKLDRLFRNAADCLKTVEEWHKKGITLHLVDMAGQSIDTGSSMGKFMITMLAGVAEMERNLIAERTATVMRSKRKRQEAFNHTPYGFDRAGMRLVANQSEQQVVQRIMELHRSNVSLRTIATILTKEGAPTKKGGRWHANTVNKVITANKEGASK